VVIVMKIWVDSGRPLEGPYAPSWRVHTKDEVLAFCCLLESAERIAQAFLAQDALLEKIEEPVPDGEDASDRLIELRSLARKIRG
jgi:hypothetical protein